MSGKTYDHGNYSIESAEIYALPQMIGGALGLVPAGGTTGEAVDATAPKPFAMAATSAVAARLRRINNVKRASARFRAGKTLARQPAGRREPKAVPKIAVVPPPASPPPPPPPPPPIIAAIAVNDIGIGNCNMLIDTVGEPVVYYDCGYPLWFFVSSAPANIRVGTPAYQGPILQNANNNLRIILSHWDWDHYRYAAITGLIHLPIYAPTQPMGPATTNFAKALRNLVLHQPNISMVSGAAYDIYLCMPPAGMPPAALLNNSGLALRVPSLLPIADANPHDVILTGDANYATMPVAAFNNVNGVVAVHHGSNAHGAGTPPPRPAATPPGANVYSYGITAAMNRPYNFPVQAAVNAYGNAGWARMAATPEAPILGAPTVIHRGNIRIGNHIALPAAYRNTAFWPFIRVIS
ncbi:MAG: hypothetical protein HEQ34_01620 [Sphingorhabdus sp.]|uniref:hypothetical protein n=1 Tax=Sphingorhabdus sp. TaxID=1902408 RepID=UPI0025F06BCA|nr:hypothetical protein [Sphingorhabdus sp.]MCO4090638.1 hypothetical protein [Sphingorhabdus sp.]